MATTRRAVRPRERRAHLGVGAWSLLAALSLVLAGVVVLAVTGPETALLVTGPGLALVGAAALVASRLGWSSAEARAFSVALAVGGTLLAGSGVASVVAPQSVPSILVSRAAEPEADAGPRELPALDTSSAQRTGAATPAATGSSEPASTAERTGAPQRAAAERQATGTPAPRTATAPPSAVPPTARPTAAPPRTAPSTAAPPSAAPPSAAPPTATPPSAARPTAAAPAPPAAPAPAPPAPAPAPTGSPTPAPQQPTDPAPSGTPVPQGESTGTQGSDDPTESTDGGGRDGSGDGSGDGGTVPDGAGAPSGITSTPDQAQEQVGDVLDGP